MTKKQMLLTSLLAAIPAAGLIIAVFLALISEVADGGMMWGLFGTTLLCSIGALAAPVVVFLLIPAEGTAVSPDRTGSEPGAADADVEDDEDFDTDDVHNAGDGDAADTVDFDDDDEDVV